MVRNTKQTSTPGQETDIVLGIISISESLQEKMKRDEEANVGISDSLEQVITNISNITPYMSATANMLVAIAGYLFGDKGVNLQTTASSLLSKVKNNEPILGTVSADKFYEQVQDEMEEAKADALEAAVEQSCAAVEIKVLFENIDNKGLDALVNVLDAIRVNYGESDLDSLENVIDAVDLLSELVEEINSAGLDKLDPKVQKKAEALSKTINSIFEINNDLKKNIVNSIIVGIFKTQLLAVPKTLAELISGKNGKGGLIMVFNHYEKLKKHNPNVVIKQVINLVNQLSDLFIGLAKISMLSIIAGIGGPKSIKKAIDKAVAIIDELNGLTIDASLGKDIKDKIKLISEVVTDVGKLMVWVSIAGILSPLAVIGAVLMMLALKVVEKLINKIIAITQNLKDTKNVEASLRPIIKMIILIGVLMTIGALVGGLVLKHISEILGFGAVFFIFSTMILGTMLIISKLFNEKDAKILKALMFAVITITAVLIIGALFMLSGLHAEALKFGGILMLFTVMIMAPLLLFSKIGGRKIRASMKDFCRLVITCTIVLIICAFFMMSNLWKESLKFAGILVLFLLMIMAPLFIFSRIGGRKMQKIMKEFIWLIVTCTLVLIIGALFMQVPEFVDGAMKFAAILVGFILAIVVPIALLSKKLRKAVRAMQMIIGIVVAGTLCLLLGALFIKEYGWENVLIFAGILAGFIGIIAGIMALLSLIPKAQLTTGMIAMGVIAGVILLGSLAMMALGEAFKKFGNWKDALIMVGILSAVILAIGLMTVAVGFVAPMVGLGMIAMLGIAAVTVVMCAVMIKVAECNDILNKITNNDPNKALSIIGTMSAVVVAVGGITIAVGFVVPLLGLGMLAMAGIAAVTVVMCSVMVKLAECNDILNKITNNNPDKALSIIGTMAKMVAAIAGISVAVGLIGPLLLYGLPFLAAIVGIALMVSNCMLNIGEALLMLQKVSAADTDISKIKTMIMSFVDVAKALEEIDDAISPWIIWKVSRSMNAVGRMVSRLGICVQDVANLKVATAWDKDGNPTGYRQLDEKDFKAAATNTKTIIDTLGYAILDIYEKAPEGMFDGSGLFGLGKSPFDKVVKSATGLSKMICKIAKGVHEISNLKVADAWDKDGNPISYRQLQYKDFKNAGNNVNDIITTLGGKLIEIYKGNESLFEPPPVEIGGPFGISIKVPGKGETVFEKVAKSCSSLGNMMSLIANGVKDLADLKIATSWDRNGNPTGYRRLQKEDFQAAADNVNLIVKTLGDELSRIYTEDTTGFYSSTIEFVDGKLQTGDCPAMRVMSVASMAGTALSNIAIGLKEFASGKVKKYSPNGYETGAYEDIDWTTVAKKGSEATAEVVTVLCNALTTVYNKDPKMFNDVVTYVTETSTKRNCIGMKSTTKTTKAVTSDPPLIKVLKVAAGLGDLVAGCAEAIRDVQNLKFDQQGWDIGGKHRERATLLVTALCLSVIDAYNKISKDWKTAVGTDFNPDNTASAVEQLNKLSTCSIEISKKTIEAVKLINKDLKGIDIAVFGEKWENMATLFAKPVLDNTISKETNNVVRDFFGSATSQNAKLDELVKTVNSLDTTKADKFMELSAELRELSTTVANFDQLVSALNGKINDTLNELSKKLELAATTIKESDKVADKRQDKVKENIKQLHQLMNKKMELELKLPEGTEMKTADGGNTNEYKDPDVGGGNDGGGNSTMLKQIYTTVLSTNRAVTKGQ